MMRKELLHTRKKWKFSGKLNENIRNGPKNVAFSIHDEMNTSKLSLKELLSDVRYLSEKLLISFSKSNKHLVVSYDTHTKETCLDLVDENLKQHSHEEADTQIPLLC